MPLIQLYSFKGVRLELNLSPSFGLCRPVDQFTKLYHIGSGTYGVVHKVHDGQNGEEKAMKKLLFNPASKDEGICKPMVREMSLLQSLTHENVVRVFEVAVGKDLTDLYLIMEYCDTNLSLLIDKSKSRFSIATVKRFVQMLLTGLNYLHSKFIVHRDLSPSNLLVTKEGVLKIADFGLARRYSLPIKPMTPEVVTLWYRAPELLLGSNEYTNSIDTWACGCLMGEMILRKPLFAKSRNDREIAVLNSIFEMLGTPDDSIWPAFSSFPVTKKVDFQVKPKGKLSKLFDDVSPNGLQLLKSLLKYDPSERPAMSISLTSRFFIEEPLPALTDKLPLSEDEHDEGDPGPSHKRRRLQEL